MYCSLTERIVGWDEPANPSDTIISRQPNAGIRYAHPSLQCTYNEKELPTILSYE